METTAASEHEQVTAEEICTLVGRYLPDGAARAAVDEGGSYVVEWQSNRLPGCRYSARSRESFDEALHLLVYRCLALVRVQGRRRGRGAGK